MSYRDELQKMFDLQKFGMKFGLEGIRSMAARLGAPQRSFPTVHLAGTNGKGSVAVMLAAMLEAAGYRVGLYTSPHLITFRERIRVGSELISEAEVLELSRRVWSATAPDSPPTFFEFVTALAFLHFQKANVDLAIIETGLGGRLDSTNIIEPLVSVITNVSLEHTEHLGDTVEKIASEKAGIIKEGRPLVLGQPAGSAQDLILAVAAEKKSPTHLLGRDFTVLRQSLEAGGRSVISFQMGSWTPPPLSLGLSGPHQVKNAALALAALQLLEAEGFKKAAEPALSQALAEASWPGRAEFFAAGAWPPVGPTGRCPLMLDGAHNPAGALALAAMLDELAPRRLHLVLGLMADKDIAGVMAPLIQRADRLYLTRPAFSRAATPGLLWDKLAAAFGQPRQPTGLYLTIGQALSAAAAEAEAEDLVLLSGSLFTVGEGRAWLKGIEEVESN